MWRRHGRAERDCYNESYNDECGRPAPLLGPFYCAKIPKLVKVLGKQRPLRFVVRTV